MRHTTETHFERLKLGHYNFVTAQSTRSARGVSIYTSAGTQHKGVSIEILQR